MNINEKVDILRRSVMQEARIRGNAILDQHKDALGGIMSQHRVEALRQQETRIKAEQVQSRQRLNMAASSAQLELKRTLGKTHEELKKKLFEEVDLVVADYMKTDEYKALLVKYIQGAISFAKGEAMTVYINPTDEDKKDWLEGQTGIALTVSKVDFIGGVRAVMHDRNILIDHAFKGAIENEYSRFLFKGGDTLAQ
ncbi:MAG: V-type ATP synthase subunit E [Lachnospiraceae bacterium]|jgi:vacuolar-type H+-ATPase subunit E/Vma4|nr:V-type ATP synthase subunit E [Lachnospiraceae bacterium]